MIAVIYYCFRVLSLLLGFRQVFVKPSGTFRDAGFEGLTYGCYLRDRLVEHVAPLTVPTYGPGFEARLHGPDLGPIQEPTSALDQKCYVSFRGPSGKLPATFRGFYLRSWN